MQVYASPVEHVQLAGRLIEGWFGWFESSGGDEEADRLEVILLILPASFAFVHCLSMSEVQKTAQLGNRRRMCRHCGCVVTEVVETVRHCMCCDRTNA